MHIPYVKIKLTLAGAPEKSRDTQGVGIE